MDNIKKSLLAFKLSNQNIRFINIYYLGGGDDGAIENVSGYTLEDAFETMNWKTLPEDYLSKLDLPYWGSKDYVSVELDDADQQLIEDIAYNYLNNIEDWYNDDGGYGTILVDIKTDSYYINNNIYYTTEQSYKHTGSFLSDYCIHKN
jgi:hypothetical protein